VLDGVLPAVQSNCTASGNLTDPCLPSVYLGFSGNDVHQRTFQSGYQITKINQFSLVAFYQRASAVVTSLMHALCATRSMNEPLVAHRRSKTE
jgi:hypothetical protein